MAWAQDDAAERRRAMVAEQIEARGVRDAAVLAAMRSVPRERFVAPDLAAAAYDDAPLPIGGGQTISQPYMVALMAELAAIRPGDRVLEIGTGSGYAAAVLSHLAGEVYSIERDADLAERAQATLAAAGFGAIHLRQGDGTLGWPEAQPFDAILVAAGGPAVPGTLRRQLADGGRLVVPVGRKKDRQRLLRIVRMGDDLVEEDHGGVLFVPLVGQDGWHPVPR